MKVGRFFSFDGRIGIGAYWGIQALAWFVAIIAMAISMMISPVLVIFPYIALAWVCWATAAKRWHDRGKSGWYSLIALIPLIGWLWVLIETGFLSGSQIENQYGYPHSGSPFTTDEEERYYRELSDRMLGRVSVHPTRATELGSGYAYVPAYTTRHE